MNYCAKPPSTALHNNCKLYYNTDLKVTSLFYIEGIIWNYQKNGNHLSLEASV